MKKKKIVIIGGGNGTALTVAGLKKYADQFDITAIVAMADSNGSSGILRRKLKTLPPGDILRVVLASSVVYDYSLLHYIFRQARFTKLGKLTDHNIGNLFLALAAQYGRNFMHAVHALQQSVQSCITIYPVTLMPSDLVARLDNGKIIRTEARIDVPNYNRNWKIDKVWLEPKAKAYAPALAAIRKADYIILSPGSLYTSIVAALLPQGIKEAIADSKAKLIYAVGNGYRTNGETGPERLSDFILQVEQYLPRSVDIVLYNNHQLTPSEKALYRSRRWGIIVDDCRYANSRVIKRYGFEDAQNGGIDAEKLGVVLQRLLV